MKKFTGILAFVCLLSFAMRNAEAQVNIGISVRIGPPVLPVYVQPACPVDGYLWEPGYWAYDDADGYYWVPGVWIAPPQPGYYWTPCYWGYSGGVYSFHPGYWGPHVGFYGGINYGYGYSGHGFTGGQWAGREFRYNTAVVNVNRTVVHNTYVDRTAVRNVNNRISYNGPGGVNRKPQPDEQAAMRERHIQPTSAQVSHQQFAAKDRSQFVKVNNGHPPAAAMNRVNGRPFDAQGHTSAAAQKGAETPNAAAKHAPNAGNRTNQPQPVSRQQQETQHVQEKRAEIGMQQRLQQNHAQQQQHPQQQPQPHQQQQPRQQPQQRPQGNPPGGEGHERHP